VAAPLVFITNNLDQYNATQKLPFISRQLVLLNDVPKYSQPFIAAAL
jgi:hypothetical protein